MTHSAIVQIRGLKKYYGRQPNIVKALDGIDLDIDEGSLTAIVGASGSGKYRYRFSKLQPDTNA